MRTHHLPERPRPRVSKTPLIERPRKQGERGEQGHTQQPDTTVRVLITIDDLAQIRQAQLGACLRAKRAGKSPETAPLRFEACTGPPGRPREDVQRCTFRVAGEAAIKLDMGRRPTD